MNIYNCMLKKAVSLTISIVFAMSSIVQAAPIDITQSNKQDSLRTISTALSTTGGSIANSIAVPRVHDPGRENLLQGQAELKNAKQALLLEAQQLLSFLANTRLEREAEPISDSDVGKVNPVILALGSPSPAAFKQAAKDWEEYRKLGFENVPVIASTGRGRGYKNFVLMTLKFLQQEDADTGTKFAEEFISRYKSEIKRAQELNADALFDEYNNVVNPTIPLNLTQEEIDDFKAKYLTEAKVIAFILEKYGVDRKVIIEEKSNNTYVNIYESLPIIERIEAQLNNGKKMKIQLVAASFHRLRALVTTIGICKERVIRNKELARLNETKLSSK